MRTGKAFGMLAWLLVIAWLVLFILDQRAAAGWCLFGAGLALFVAAPAFRRTGDSQLRITAWTMLGAGVFFVVFGLVLAL